MSFSSIVLARSVRVGFMFLFGLIALALGTSGLSSAGVIDRSFGDRGWQQLPPRLEQSVFKPAGVKQVNGGGFRAFGQMNRDLAIFAYTSDGYLDTDFHDRGWHMLELARGNGNDTDSPIGILSAGPNHSVVAGSILVVNEYRYFSALTITRVGDDGKVDRAFGSGGTTLVTRLRAPVSVATGSGGRVYTISQNDSKGGGALGKPLTPAAVQVARFTKDGSLDRLFGKKGIVRRTNGVETSAVGISSDRQGRLLVLTKDRIGESRSDSETRSTLVRLLPSGRIDSSFGKRGVALRTGKSLTPRAVQTLSNGRILVAGQLEDSPGWTFIRYLPDGTMDPTFGIGGVKTTAGSRVGEKAELRLLGGDDFVIAGNRGIAQFDDDGNLVLAEPSVNPGGRGYGASEFGIAGNDTVVSVRASKAQPVLEQFVPGEGTDPQLTEHGKPQQPLNFRKPNPLSGFTRTANGALAASADLPKINGYPQSRLYRFKPGGATDRAFGDEGSLEVSGRKREDLSFASELMPAKGDAIRVLGPGRTNRALVSALVGVRGGQQNTALEGLTRGGLADAAATRDGGLVTLAGKDFTVARFDVDGTPAKKFGKDGTTRVKLPGFRIQPRSLSLDRRGRILVSGTASCNKKCGPRNYYESRPVFARFLADGSRDRTFGRRGIVAHRIGFQADSTQAITLRDGRIIARTNDNCFRKCGNLTLLGLTPDGSIDLRFGQNGRLSRDIGRYFQLHQLLPAGRHGVDLASDIEPCGEEAAVGVIRLNRSGGLDRSFGGGDGNIRAIPRGAVAAYAYEVVKQSRETVTMSAYLEPRGRYGGIEDTAGITRLKLNASDGKTSLRPCGR